MTTTHTPGPWEVKPVEKNKPYLRVRGTRLGCRYKICNVHMEHPDVAGDSAEAEANARLIAAAPDLLSACKMLIESGYIVRDGINNQLMILTSEPVLDAAREAIARAEGTK